MKEKTRDQKILEAKTKIRGLKLLIEPLLAGLHKVEAELSWAESSHDLDSTVRVETKCPQGCCTEYEYKGTVVGLCPNGSYNVKSDDGKVHHHVSRASIKPVRS